MPDMISDAYPKPGRLGGKSAVITGAAKGIGRATAQLFAVEGARLVITDIDAAGLGAAADDLRSMGAEVVDVDGDVAEAADAEAMITAAVKAFGVIDILVANAGSSRSEPFSTPLRMTGTG